MAFYDDENYVNQYYFGDAFMISPIIKPLDEVFNRTIQRIFIPEGVWYDFKTGKRFLGNHKYISFYTIDDYPIFVKQGSIIPLAGENSFMSCDNPKDLEIHIFPGESNTYQLYEDDGITNEYLNGKYNITEIDYNYRKSNYTVIIRPVEGNISVIPTQRDYKIVFRNTKRSDNVVVYDNDKKIDNFETEATETSFIVYIKNIDTKDQLSINCYGEDIEIDSIKLVKDDIDSILFDLKISTVLKDEVAAIVFNDKLSLAKKRISIRKLKRKGLDPRSVKAFLRLLDYMEM
jgi:alpha-glucosidase (family GH31 glycosyl hydrolase)